MKIITAKRKHKDIVLKLIVEAFAKDPQIVAYTNGSKQKICLIASLAFEVCLKSNSIYLTDDLHAVAICYPSVQENSNFNVVWENLKFPFIFGMPALVSMMKIEKMIVAKRKTPQKGLYLWLLATNPISKGQGHGTALLSFLDNQTVYNEIILETSNAANLSYYQKRGFEMYDSLVAENQLSIYFFRKSLF